VGLDIEKINRLQSRVRDRMLFYGHAEDADDASQDYALKILEDMRAPNVEYFCDQYLKKQKDYCAESFFEIDNDYDTSQIENEIDYSTLMGKVFRIKNSRHRRIMIFYFFSGLRLCEIANKERIRYCSVYRIIRRSLSSLRSSVLLNKVSKK